ncbi:hypothetical protein LINPERHAP1_LOCUS36993 [Linum perenne]
MKEQSDNRRSWTEVLEIGFGVGARKWARESGDEGVTTEGIEMAVRKVIAMMMILLQSQQHLNKYSSCSSMELEERKKEKPNAFAGVWDANVTAKNPNTKIRLFFNQIETFMFFGDEELAASYANLFSLDINGVQSALTAKMAANRTADGGEDEGEAMKKMAEDFGKGAVEFNLRMAAWTTFRSDSWWMKVGFSGKSGNGSLVTGRNRDCLVLV